MVFILKKSYSAKYKRH